MIKIVSISLIFTLLIAFKQATSALPTRDFPTYSAYFTGDTTDVITQAQGGVCLMGGGKEDDEAIRWFLRRCNGGDVLVLRASGADGYNNYMMNLGIPVNSVESIVFKSAEAAQDPYVLKQIANAEAIWFAGGDQWNYVKYWRNSPVDSIINNHIINKKIVVGGSSAGMAILGTPYFSAELGTVQSDEALNAPLSDTISIQNQPFLNIPYLQNIITDTHYANRKRQGRHIAFLAKALLQWGIPVKGMACDESTAVCVDTSGKAFVFGTFPKKEHSVYFLQMNCELENPQPEINELNQPLTWDRQHRALKVYQIKAEPNGKYYFDLNDWKTGSGGTWQHWYVVNGQWQVEAGTAPNCK